MIEGEIVPIYENNKGEKLINARELHELLKCNTKFADWMKRRILQYGFIENKEFFCFLKIEKAERYGNKTSKEYYLKIKMAKELCMVENNSIGKKLRQYFIEIEERYRSIIETPRNIFDIMHQALNQIEENENNIKLLKNKITN